jgi:hypothetical protein
MPVDKHRIHIVAPVGIRAVHYAHQEEACSQHTLLTWRKEEFGYFFVPKKPNPEEPLEAAFATALRLINWN